MKKPAELLFYVATVLIMSSACLGVFADSDGQCADASGGVTRLVGQIQAQVNSWNAFLVNIVEGVAVSSQIDLYRQNHGVPMSFYRAVDAGDLPSTFSGLERDEGLCGPYFTVFVKSLGEPEVPGEAGLRGDPVLELNDDGEVVHRWPREYNWLRVSGVRGDEILVSYTAASLCAWGREKRLPHYDMLLAIRPDGSFRLIDPISSIPAVDSLVCDTKEHFGKSVYASCWEYRDLEDGERRVLMFDRPCT